MGWMRVAKYYRLRVVRLSSSVQSIAINLAAGSAISFTPFFGIHIFGAMGFSWLVGARINVIAVIVGTLMGNPWTFPFLLYASYSVGGWVFELFDAHDVAVGLTPEVVEQQGENMLTFLKENFSDIFVPTAVGGTILAIVSFPLYYMLYYYLVEGAQKARRLRMARKQRALFNRKAKGKIKKGKS